MNEIKTSQMAMDLEDRYGAHNYHPLPVVLAKGQGVFMWDVEGKRFFDFLSAYSAVNQGHCHPKIIQAMIDQASTLELTSRAFYNNVLGVYEKFVTEYFGYQRVLPMNTGAEGDETALKLTRKWGYKVKGIPENQAKIICCENNFHGRTISVISMSNDPQARDDFGPFTPGFIPIPYNDLKALEKALEDPNVAGFLVEPIQGEAGVFVPDEGYLKKAYELCKAKNVLFIADEVQTGIARTGKLLACDWEGVRPDVLILGKALSGGVMPISAVLADDPIMLTIKPGEHGSTFGGNPLACAAAKASINFIIDDNLLDKSKETGSYFMTKLNQIKEKYSIINEVRGKGLMIGVELNTECGNIIDELFEMGIIVNCAAGNVLRFVPPLTISKKEIDEVVFALIKYKNKNVKK